MSTIPSEVPRRSVVTAVKALHTLIWFVVEASVGFLLYTGLRGRSDRTTAIAWGIVIGESAIFLGNGARCPLTAVAESLGADRGSVTDIYLPKWLARNLPAVHVPLVLAIGILHGRSLGRSMRPAG